MAMKSSQPRASWRPEEVATLIHFLHEHRSEVGDGGNFKKSTYVAAAAHINKTHPTAGQLKTQDAMKNKWSSYIESYRGCTGAHWDGVKGAGIEGRDAAQVFDDYVKHHPLLHPFKSSGWEFHELLQDIIPNGAAHGKNSFTPAATSGSANTVTSAGIPVSSTAAEFCITLDEDVHGVLPSNQGKEHLVESPQESCDLLQPPLTTNKCSYAEMTGDVADSPSGGGDMNPLPFYDATISGVASVKQMNMDSAMGHVQGSSSRRQPSQVAQESLMLETGARPQEKLSKLREAALLILLEQDNDFPREIKAFIWSLFTHDPGFTEVYVLTTDKEAWEDYVMHEYRVKSGNMTMLNVSAPL
ncbi:hypothetical protein EDC04DRAFT_2602663 [Pisolithus marmoratus]|nr:hypothetical protein EDC04DRAFT_2602663 [Pisolithus marmoratus]